MHVKTTRMVFEKNLRNRRVHKNSTDVQFVSVGRLKNLTTASSIVLMSSLFIAFLSVHETTSVDNVFSQPAKILAFGLVLSTWIETRAGLRNIIRADIFMLLGLYFLTFFEFLLPIPPVALLVSLEAARTGVNATLLGFAGLVLGRHLVAKKFPMPKTLSVSISQKMTFRLLIVSALLGNLFMLIAVNFNVFEVIRELQQPRFAQPWGRGRYGSFSTLLNEIGLLRFLVPPLSAAIIVHRKKYSLWQTAIAVVLLIFTLFEGFAGGTRSVFLTHLVTFGTAYVLLARRITLRLLFKITMSISILAYLATFYLPEIRTAGLENFDFENSKTERLVVDLNILNISSLTQVFPDLVPYLGFEIPYIAAIRPIPRAIWPGKPLGLSIGIEEALGAKGLTLSATFVGELWMAGGYFAVFLGAIFFGAAASWWNRKAANLESNFDMIIFAAGFFPAGLCMRSFLSVFPAVLPVFAIIIFKKLHTNRQRKRKSKWHQVS